MSVRIGVDNLVYAPLTLDNGTAAPTYGAVKNARGVISLNINPNSSQDTLFADDGPSETAVTLGKVEVEINKSYLTTTEEAEILGHQVDAKGGIIYSANDVPPWIAIGFRSLMTNGKYKYTWLHKGKFTDPEVNHETKGDSVNFQTDTIKGQFVMINKEYIVNGKPTKPYKYSLNADDAAADATLLASWFTAVQLPTPDA